LSDLGKWSRERVQDDPLISTFEGLVRKRITECKKSIRTAVFTVS
jgi:hypothetical protein